MNRIYENIEYSYEIEKSRFIGYLMRCFSVEEAKTKLEEIRKLHPFANHVVHAYKIGNSIAHSSDDKEPSGTAGTPIKEVLDKNDLTDVIAIVVRYFGGIKLGAGGLTRAYSKTIADAIKLAIISKPMILDEYLLELDYSLLSKAEYLIRKNYTLVKIEYTDKPKIIFRTIDDPTNTILELTQGKCIPKLINKVETEIILKRPNINQK